MKHIRILTSPQPKRGSAPDDAPRRSRLRVGGIAAAAAVAAAAGLVALHPSVSQASPAVNSNALYVSPSGTDSAAGTQSAPTTLTSAITRITAGGTIYMRGGTYDYSSTVTIAQGNNGSSGALKELSAYPGESPVLNFSAMAEADSNRGLALNGNYWHLYGLTVQRAGDNGIFVGGSNNVVERTVTAFNHDSGLQISRVSSSSPRSQWPSNNLILSSESHDNSDSGGENADGFAAKLTAGPGNVFRYDVSHNNIDDGWDLYTKSDTGPIGVVTIENSLSYDNGTLSNGTVNSAGDRNGFKLGGEKIAVNHVVRNSIAYHNGHDGFTYNSNPGDMTVTGNVSIDNSERNFHWESGNSVFRNDTSCRFDVDGSNDKLAGSTDSTDQFWTGTNGSRCSSYDGALGWSYGSDGVLNVTFGGTHVTGGSTTSGSTGGTATGGSTTGGTTDGGTSTNGGATTGGTGTGGGCKATYTPSSWPGGFTANVTVTNTGSAAVNGWTAAFTLPAGQVITSAWNATISPSSGAVTATDVSYNAQIPVGGSQSFGFQGTYTGGFAQPTHFTLNGTTCTTG